MNRPKRRYNGQALGKRSPIKSKTESVLRTHEAITRLLKDVLVNEPPKDPDPPAPPKPKRKR